MSVATPAATAAPTLLYSETEDDLRASVRGLLTDRSPWPEVLRRTESDQPYDPDLWRRLATELGVAGLPIGEADGGAGASWRETAIVLEELGRAVTPSPFFGSAVLATAAAMACGAGELLGQLATGEHTGTLAIPLSTGPDDPFPAAVRGDGSTVSGSISSVADARSATVVLVPATDQDGPALYQVDATRVGIAPVLALDLTRPLADLNFDAATATRLASGDQAEEAIRVAVRTGAGLLASEQLGLAERCLEMTVEYLKSRYQFGRPVGSFQALKHRLADLWVAITQSRALARYAAACLATDHPDTDVAVSLAQAHCSATAVLAAEECVQLHGGIGFTWEHPAHLYLKRAKSSALTLGTPDRHRIALARLVDLPAP
ncbi:MAG: acyl-CoA/acyl-ACP dehydrogenase [Sporichthyaceae bacterium]|nr:acyl-CoA/acyl-ACP dehydrogenase [Sporichthyaceae bacterium]